jgi:hypothetical protein
MSEKHEPAGAAMYPAIPHLAGDIASGRVEDSILIAQNICTECKIFVQKKTSPMLPPAILPSGLAPGRNQRPPRTSYQ